MDLLMKIKMPSNLVNDYHKKEIELLNSQDNLNFILSKNFSLTFLQILRIAINFITKFISLYVANQKIQHFILNFNLKKRSYDWNINYETQELIVNFRGIST